MTKTDKHFDRALASFWMFAHRGFTFSDLARSTGFPYKKIRRIIKANFSEFHAERNDSAYFVINDQRLTLELFKMLQATNSSGIPILFPVIQEVVTKGIGKTSDWNVKRRAILSCIQLVVSYTPGPNEAAGCPEAREFLKLVLRALDERLQNSYLLQTYDLPRFLPGKAKEIINPILQLLQDQKPL